MSARTLLEVIKHCHNHDPWKDIHLRKLTLLEPKYAPAADSGKSRRSWHQTVIGFMPQFVIDELLRLRLMMRDEELQDGDPRSWRNWLESAYPEETMLLTDGMGTIHWLKHEKEEAQFSDNFRRMLVKLKEETQNPAIKEVLNGWRDELYAIYGKERDLTSPNRERRILCKVERAACSLFGFATFGVHCTGYTKDLKVWVPRRSNTKQTWPGFLDNTVAGGITAGESQRESMVRECAEEAGLEDEFVRPRLKSTGAISYFYRSTAGLSQPEVEYTYDLLLPDDVIPRPVDGEAESFELMKFAQVMERIRYMEFKPNSALVLIDFYIRHGLITSETEPDYLEIISLMRTDLELPGP